jgi:lysophospholipase L1-like esterase
MKKFLWFGLCLLVAPVFANSQGPEEKINIIVLGSSTAEGAGPRDRNNAWVNRYRAYLQMINPQINVINLSCGGYTTYHLMPDTYAPPADRPAPDKDRNITKALALHPAGLIVNLPSNDTAYGYAVREQLANFDTLLTRAQAQNIPIWITTTQPRNLSELQRKDQRALRDSLLARLGGNAIDFWNGIAANDDKIRPDFDSGDGIHLNDAAHRLLFERVAAARVHERLARATGGPKPLDDFETLAGWKPIAAAGVRIDTALATGRTGRCVKIDFNFVAGAGYCGIQKRFPMTLPANYQFSFYVKGDAPVNNLEFKLVDASGDNVWWLNQRNFEFPPEWTKITIKKRHINFAWGPTPDRELKNFDKVEFFVASSTGGKGAIFLDDFTFQELEPSGSTLPTPIVSASTRADEMHAIASILDNNQKTQWRSAAQPEQQEIQLDLGKNYEYGGLVIDWDVKDFAQQYNVLVSAEGSNWEKVYAVTKGKGGRSYVYLKDQESRYIKLELLASARKQGYAINDLAIKANNFSEHPETFFTQIARDFPRGFFPKYLQGEQSYWTVVGVNNDTKEALINEEGMVEVDKNNFSIEPFVFCNGEFVHWNKVTTAQTLEKDYLPIPTVTWQHPDLQLHITAFAAGAPDSSLLVTQYVLKNHGKKTLRGHLYLAIRPFQVNPPWQFLNWPGGTAKVKTLRRENNTVVVNEQKKILLLDPCDNFGALAFDEGDITEYISRDTLPMATNISDHFGYAAGALQYGFVLSPGQEKQVALAVPFHENYFPHLPATPATVMQVRQEVAKFWETKINTAEFRLPPSATKLVNVMRSYLGYILINRDRAGIQPGSRSYERSWIRDGALTSAALLRFGIQQEVRDYIDWYASHQYPNGKVPCVVDTRGADPVPENDSHGEFIYAILQYFHFTKDTLWLRQKFPQVVKTVEYIEFLRNQRKTEIYLTGTAEQRACYGLLPESISHEGYSAKPMHSYWDDFFGLKGLKDATTIAGILGERERKQEFAAARDDFKRNLYASMRMAMANKGIDFIPGCVELGDFDATSTTIGLDPCGELENIPQPQLNNTFEKYYQYFSQRRDNKIDWRDYTPYEVRNIGALLLLGQKERSHELLNFFLKDQRPAGWNHWAEVVWRNHQEPRFIGDMPHTWVGSDFIRAIRNMFAYERESDNTLVLGAGILEEWLNQPAGIEVRGVETHYGTLSYSMKKSGQSLTVNIWGKMHFPEGKIILKSPCAVGMKSVRINGKSSIFKADEVQIDAFPANVILYY